MIICYKKVEVKSDIYKKKEANRKTYNSFHELQLFILLIL